MNRYYDITMRERMRNGDEYRDGRNPYGSRGGYVVNSRRDRAMDYNDYRNDDMAYDREYDSRQYDMEYSQPDYRYDRRRNEYDRRYDYDYNDYAPMRLTRKEIKSWERNLESADGTKGKKFSLEQIMPIAQQMNIKFEDFSEDDLCMAVNMLYSDFCPALGSDLTLYIKLAKLFFEDDDSDSTGAEKLARYYHKVVHLK